MRSFFINRQYPAAIVDRAMHKAFSIDRTTALTPKTRADNNRIPFTITFHPINNSIKPIVNRNFNLLNSDSVTSNIFTQRPLFSFKKDRNLRAFLVKGILPCDKEPGTFRCSRKRCLTCPFVAPRTSVTGPKSTINITDHFDCTTSNIIYCIQCSHCNQLYIGETGRRLGDRIRDHLYDIRNNDLSKPVSRHFNSSNHSISNLVAFGISRISGGNDCRKTKEMRLIHALGTLNPHGINERFAFN